MKRTMEPMELLTSSTPYSVYNFHLPQSLKKKAEQLCWEYNQLPPGQEDRRREILGKLFGTCDPKTFVMPGFRCDYGFNIHTHGLAFINYNCVILDTSPVHIGANAFIAPAYVSAVSATPWMPNSGQRRLQRQPPLPWRTTCGSVPML